MEQVEFKDFRIGELFDVVRTLKPGIRLKTQKFQNEEYNLPATSSTETNNSIGFYVKEEDHIEVKDVLSVTSNGAAGFICYHPERIAVAQDSYLIKSKEELKNSRSFYLYVSAVLSKQTRAKFSYTNKCTWSKLANLKISLPATSSGTPDYSYMESYISYIEKLHVANIQQAHTLRIEKILKELDYNSLKDAELTAEDKEILRLFSEGGLTLAEFKIGELFDTSLWKYSLQSQNFLSTSPVKTSTHDLAVVTGTVVNNSIAYYVNRDEVNESNIYSKTLTMTTRGQSGVVKFQEEEFLLHNNSLALCGVFEKLNKNKKVALYVMAALNKLGYGNSYSNFPTVKTLSKDTIPLPINPQSPTIPNYSLMESYITAIEKLHVNKLISSHNQEITTLNTVTKKCTLNTFS